MAALTTPVTLPLWLVLIFTAVLLWFVLARLLVPSVRWFFRSRANRVIDELNKRLEVELPHFALTKRQVLVDRLLYDPLVGEAVTEHCRDTGAPRDVVMMRVERYAKEIVPSFNAYVYFRFGTWVCKRLAATLYRMRLGGADEEGLAHIGGASSSVVFVMNHRSNMDYVLVAYLALHRTALSYAVGEWARVWPLQQLISAMGAYFVRRGSGNPLYRRVLERYVWMSVEGGVTQAIYPEGGLSRDGRLQPPKLGLLDYMVRNFDPQGARDLVFIPVGINYDRTLEDRSLLRSLDTTLQPVGRMRALGTAFAFTGRNVWQMLRGRWSRFGHACANFGAPVSLRAWMRTNNVDFRELDREQRFAAVGKLADQLMDGVGRVVPVLPVSLISTALLERHGFAPTLPELRADIDALLEKLNARRAPAYVPGRNWTYAIELGLRILTLRNIVILDGGRYQIAAGEEPLLRYYANSIAHHLTS